MQKLSRWIFKMIGWTAVISVEEPPKSVICVAPHTSNWDFIIGKLFYWSVDRKSSFLMKKSWFFFPFGALLRSAGGIAVDRTKHTSVTEQMTEEFSKHDTFHLAITPEGTRKLMMKWKMGFYYIAVNANAPIQLAYIDYEKKEMGIKAIIYPSGDENADLATIQAFYKDIKAKHQDRFYRN